MYTLHLSKWTKYEHLEECVSGSTIRFFACFRFPHCVALDSSITTLGTYAYMYGGELQKHIKLECIRYVSAFLRAAQQPSKVP